MRKDKKASKGLRSRKRRPKQVSGKSARTATDEHDLLPEYDFRGGARGKYARRFSEGTNLVLLDADVRREFPSAESVNAALRFLIQVERRFRRKA